MLGNTADGDTYGNLCMLNAADVKLDYEGECVVAQPESESPVVEIEETVSISESTAVVEPELVTSTSESQETHKTSCVITNKTRHLTKLIHQVMESQQNPSAVS